MTYAEAVGRLLALRGGELQGMRPGLERIEALLAAIGNPERRFDLVQVGGTNGKGSVSALLAACLEAAGRRVGLYTSPHLVEFSERIRVNGQPIAPSDVVDGVEALGTLVARLDATMFEATTALALDHFAQAGVEVAVLEVGLGGRLDSTTVGRPVAEILARIDLDHQRYLGDTLAAIAAEKAAIIRSGVALSARQAPEAEAVVLRRAAEAGVPLLLEGRDLSVSVRRFSLEAQHLDLAGPGFRLEDARCRLIGVYQPGNALLAAAAAHRLGVPERAILAGLATAEWPGRFQILRREPLLLLDGAHNPAGVRALADSLRAYFPGQPVTLVLGISADKDHAGILGALCPVATRLILTGFAHPRAARPAALLEAVPPGGPAPEVAASPAEALAMAQDDPATPMVCVAGSLFLIGEVLAQVPEKLTNLGAREGRC